MSWLKLDDGFPNHPKVIGLSNAAFRLHVTALCFCAQNVTDGYISTHTWRVSSAGLQSKKRATDELVEARLWVPAGDGWVIHDYLDMNPSKADIQAKKKVASENAKSRWTPRPPDANGNATGIADGSAEGNALPSHPIPTHEALASTLAFALSAGEDAHASGNTDDLIRACGNTTQAAEKIRRTIKARGSSYETIARATDAARAPNVRDRLAVALAILAPKVK